MDNRIIIAYREASLEERKEFFLWLKFLRMDFKHLDEVLEKTEKTDEIKIGGTD